MFPAQTKSLEYQKSGHVRILYLTFSKYSRPLNKLVLAGDATTDRHFLELVEMVILVQNENEGLCNNKLRVPV